MRCRRVRAERARTLATIAASPTWIQPAFLETTTPSSSRSAAPLVGALRTRTRLSRRSSNAIGEPVSGERLSGEFERSLSSVASLCRAGDGSGLSHEALRASVASVSNGSNAMSVLSADARPCAWIPWLPRTPSRPPLARFVCAALGSPAILARAGSARFEPAFTVAFTPPPHVGAGVSSSTSTLHGRIGTGSGAPSSCTRSQPEELSERTVPTWPTCFFPRATRTRSFRNWLPFVAPRRSLVTIARALGAGGGVATAAHMYEDARTSTMPAPIGSDASPSSIFGTGDGAGGGSDCSEHSDMLVRAAGNPAGGRVSGLIDE